MYYLFLINILMNILFKHFIFYFYSKLNDVKCGGKMFIFFQYDFLLEILH